MNRKQVEHARRLQEVRAEIAMKWFDANPHGGNAKDVRVALTMCQLATVQKLMAMMREQGMIVAIGAGAHIRYCAPRHLEAAQQYAKACVTASTIKRREIKAQRAQECIAVVARPNGTSVEEKHQAIVREWPKPKKPGVCSVFELAVACS